MTYALSRVGIYGTGTRHRAIAWDEVRKVRLSGGPYERHVLTIREEHVPFGGVGLGTITRKDVGRVLVADLGEDGHWITAFALPGQQPFGKARHHGDMGSTFLMYRGCCYLGSTTAGSEAAALLRYAGKCTIGSRGELRAVRVTG